MPGVADPVHQAKRRIGRKAFPQVILDHNGAAGDTPGLAKKHARVIGVMQHIDEHDAIERLVSKRNRRAIE